MERSREWLRSNKGIGIILTLGLIAFLVGLELSPWVHKKVRDGFTLGFFPVLGVVLMIIFSAMMIFDTHRREIPEGLQAFRVKSFLGGLVIIIVSWIYFAVMREAGFLIATPIYLLCFIHILGIKSWRTCAISAVIMTVIVYAVFTIIGINLPSGILSGILPF